VIFSSFRLDTYFLTLELPLFSILHLAVSSRLCNSW